MNFSDLKTQTLAAPTLETVASLRNITFSKARTLLTDGIPAALSTPRLQPLRTLLGLSRAARLNHACNLLTMRKLHAAMAAGMAEASMSIHPRRLSLVTFTPDDWLIDEYNPVLNLTAARRDSANWLRALGLSGLGMFEFEPFLNHPMATAGRAIGLHLHFVGIPADQETFAGRVASYAETHQGKCSIGLFVHQRPIQEGLGHIHKTSSYGLKPVISAKRVTPSRDHAGAYKLRNAPLPAQLALRTAELMSYVAPSRLIVTRHSSGWGWRQRILGLAELSAGPKRPSMLDDQALNTLWASVWSAAGVTAYGRVQVI